MDKKITIGIIATLIFIGAAFSEITGVKFPVGGTVLHDSSAAILTINKNVYIGGQARVSSIKFKEYNSLITEGISEMVLNSPAYNFQTLAEEPIATLDSASGLNLYQGNLNVDNYTALGSGNIEIKTKLIRGVLPNTSGVWVNFAHGLSSRYRVIGIQWSVQDDSLSTGYAGGYNASTPTLTGFLTAWNNTNITYFFPLASVNLKNDTIQFLVTYKE